MLTLNLPKIAKVADTAPTGTVVASKLNTPLATIVPKASCGIIINVNQ